MIQTYNVMHFLFCIDIRWLDNPVWRISYDKTVYMQSIYLNWNKAYHKPLSTTLISVEFTRFTHYSFYICRVYTIYFITTLIWVNITKFTHYNSVEFTRFIHYHSHARSSKVYMIYFTTTHTRVGFIRYTHYHSHTSRVYRIYSLPLSYKSGL